MKSYRLLGNVQIEKGINGAKQSIIFEYVTKDDTESMAGIKPYKIEGALNAF